MVATDLVKSLVELTDKLGPAAGPFWRTCLKIAGKGGLRMHRLSTVLCTSGLAAEARIARAAGFPVVIGAGDRERTAALVERAVKHANCLVSFGIAGALAPNLRAGDLVVSAEVVSDDDRWRAEERFQTHVCD